MLPKFIVNNINEFIGTKLQEKKETLHIDSSSFKKYYATIIACHIDTEEKLWILKKNLENISFPNNDMIVINTAYLPWNHLVKRDILDKGGKYMEVKNDGWLDFGKWSHVLHNIDYSSYDFITFTNDSFIICESIVHFYYQASIHNVELYAYTSSTEMKYHYQSYLFIVSYDAIKKFIQYLEMHMKRYIPKPVQMELDLYDIFSTKQCFLDIGLLPINYKQNILFDNTGIYTHLFNSKLLPFIKLKRIHPKQNQKQKRNYHEQLSKYDFNLLSRGVYRGFSNDFKSMLNGVQVFSAPSPFSQNKFNREGLNPDIQETLG